MKAIAWLYALFSLIIAGLGVYFAAYLPSKMMTEGATTTGPFLASVLGGLAVLILWMWFVRQTRKEGGEEGMPVIEFRSKEVKPGKAKKKQR